MTTANSSETVVVRQRFKQDRSVVFDAFTRAAALEQWLSPSSDIKTRVIEFDFRPGGLYEYGFVLPDGNEISYSGEFLIIDPLRHISFTWQWAEPDPHAGIATLVTIDFVEANGGTELTVTHDKFPSQDMRERHTAGWRGALGRLEIMLEETQDK